MSTADDHRHEHPEHPTGESMNTHHTDHEYPSVNGAVNGAEVIPLHRTIPPWHTTGDGSPGAEVEPRVLEGELLTPEENATLDRRLSTHAVRRLGAVIAERATGLARVIRESDPPKRAVKAALREGLTLWQGIESWAGRAYDASSHGVYRRQIKAAEAIGDEERLEEWTERLERAKERRHKRMMELPALALGAARVALGGFAALVVLVLLLGLFTQLSGRRGWPPRGRPRPIW